MKYNNELHPDYSAVSKKTIKGTRIETYAKKKVAESGYRLKDVWDHKKHIYGLFDDGTREGLVVTLGYSDDRVLGNYRPCDFAGGSYQRGND